MSLLPESPSRLTEAGRESNATACCVIDICNTLHCVVACYRLAMLERAALHQSRFRTPGVNPDVRGVVLGERGLVLFASLDRAVAFLRAYGEEGSLDELVPSLAIRRVITPLRTREILLSVIAESSYRMDRVAGIARLSGGLVFTGTSRHFVKYRDSASPLGYDVQELDATPADLLLYHDAFQQAYTYERDLDFRELLLKLSLELAPESERRPPTRLYATAETGVGHALVRYLFRWQVKARAAIAEWPGESAFDDGPRRAHVFELNDVPPRIVKLLTSLPGVRLFEPIGESVAVQLGYRHPVALDSCPSLFKGDMLTLFRADAPVDVITPLPPFAPVRSLVRTELTLAGLDDDTGGARQRSARRVEGRSVEGRSVEEIAPMTLPLRLRASSGPWRQVRATVVPLAERVWLARMLYVLPPRTLAALRIALTADAAYLVDSAGIEGVPLGVFYSEVAPRIYVPAGTTLEPAVGPDVLSELVRNPGEGLVFFEPGHESPTVVPAAAFGPVTRRALRTISAVPVSGEPPDIAEPELPLLEYGEPSRFPLRNLPGRDAATRALPNALPSALPSSSDGDDT